MLEGTYWNGVPHGLQRWIGHDRVTVNLCDKGQIVAELEFDHEGRQTRRDELFRLGDLSAAHFDPTLAQEDADAWSQVYAVEFHT